MIVVHDDQVDVFDLVISGKGQDKKLHDGRDQGDGQNDLVAEDLPELFLQQYF
jgi:hypothetical protein